MNNEETTNELRDIVRGYHEELHKIVNGEIFADDEDRRGDWTTEETDEEGNERHQVSIFDWMYRHALSIENWKIDKDGKCVGGTVLLGFGGPNIYMDERQISAYWGCSQFFYEISEEVSDALLDFLTETLPTRRA